jgi:hypothetical protein
MAVPRNLSSEALVFVTNLGTPRDPDGFSKSFQHLARRKGIRVTRMHDVRHTAATLLKDLGVPAKDAQLILGHSDIATTQQIYQHDTLENREVALKKIEAILLPPKDHAEIRSVVSIRSAKDVRRAGRCRQTSVYCRQITGPGIALMGLLTSVNTWYARRDSNPRPLVPETNALSN